MCNAFGQWHYETALPILAKGKNTNIKINFMRRVTMLNSFRVDCNENKANKSLKT